MLETLSQAPGRVTALVRELRVQCDKLLLRKISDPTLEIGTNSILTAIIQLITTEKAGA